MSARPLTKAAENRNKLRDFYWPEHAEQVWRGPDEVGYCPVPRTMPLILSLLRSPRIVDKLNLDTVYMDLWCHDMGQGIIEIVDVKRHAFGAGYTSIRAVRSWKERMLKLQQLGFIDIKQVGMERFGVVLMIHPTIAIEKLHAAGQVEEGWWNMYLARKVQTKEPMLAGLRDSQATARAT